jgi:SAM-dependent methyltransferase
MSEFDEYSLSYEDDIQRAIEFGGKPHDFYTRVKADVLLELLQQRLKGTYNLLDVGCGSGLIHPFLLSSEIPVQVTGVDVAAKFLTLARKANPGVSYDLYDGQHLPYRAAQFDAAFTICVMHHVEPGQWRQFVAEMNRVVRPGGLVAVFEHNPFNPLTAHIVRSCPIDRNAVLLRPRRLIKLMRDVGLEGVICKFFLFTPLSNAISRRLDRLMHWLPLGAQYVSYGRAPTARPVAK